MNLSGMNMRMMEYKFHVAIHLGPRGWFRPARGHNTAIATDSTYSACRSTRKLRSMPVWRRVGRVPASPDRKLLAIRVGMSVCRRDHGKMLRDN